jgi:transposase
MKFKEYNQDQPWLIPPDIEDEVPQNDLCRVINEVLETIDIRFIENQYKEEGNTAFHPRMMIKVLFYSYARGIFSSRKISQELESNIFYWYLSGKQRPNFRTICEFRKRHKKDLRNIFIKIVKLCIGLGFARISTAVIDSTKMKANASRDKFRDKEWIDKNISHESEALERALEESELIDKNEDIRYGRDKRGDEIPEEIRGRKARLEKLEELNKELEEKELNRIHETDTEAKLMKSHGHFIPAYNCQTIVDEESQIILMADVTDSENDWYQIKPNVESIKKEYGKKPDLLIGDAGYCDGESLQYLKDENIEGIIPDKNISEIKAELENNIPEDKKFKKDQFKYYNDKDVYICPEGKELKRVTIKPAIAKRKSGNDIEYHKYQHMGCNNCLQKSLCCRSKSNRSITRYVDEELREEMAAKIRSKRGYELYKLRMKTVEPIFGNIKHNMGFRSFSLRGLLKTGGEFYIIAAVHNIKKIKKYLKNQTIAQMLANNDLVYLLRTTINMIFRKIIKIYCFLYS